MRLAESDGKALLRRHGVALPRSVLLSADEAPPADAAQRLAELKMLKMLQAEVYDTTKALEDARRRMGELSAEEKAELDAISQQVDAAIRILASLR